MEDNNKSYFGEIGSAVKTLAIGMKTTLTEYFTKKSTEQYPEPQDNAPCVGSPSWQTCFLTRREPKLQMRWLHIV